MTNEETELMRSIDKKMQFGNKITEDERQFFNKHFDLLKHESKVAYDKFKTKTR